MIEQRKNGKLIFIKNNRENESFEALNFRMNYILKNFNIKENKIDKIYYQSLLKYYELQGLRFE